SFPHVKSVILQPVWPREGRQEFIPADELEKALSQARQASIESGIVVLFRPYEAPAPCLFRNIDGIKSFFLFPPFHEKENKKGFQRIDMCEDCMLRSRCGGVHPQFDKKENALHYAVSTEFARFALEEWSEANRAEQIGASCKNDKRAFPVGKNDIEEAQEELLLRINYNCNEKCLFCFVDHRRDSMSDAEIDAFAEFLNNREPCDIIISGGEPTLSDNLVEHIKKLKKANARSLSIQTNAVLLHRKENVEELASAGLDFAVVSLHSHDPVISGVLTGNRDSFEKTIQGIVNLRDCGLSVFISHVINTLNYPSLSDFVRFSSSELGRAPIAFSSVEAMSCEDMNRGFAPMHSEIKHCLANALDLCYELRVPFFRLASKSGFPLCILDGNPKYFHDAVFVGDGCSNMPNMIKPNACSACGLSDYCSGINRFYAMYYGFSELCPSKTKGFKPLIQYQRDSQKRWFDHIVQQWLLTAESTT
ncbi:MAG TPA: radical SAM protein, partial [bacterium]|nr:radical SAM protein [bacterium]